MERFRLDGQSAKNFGERFIRNNPEVLYWYSSQTGSISSILSGNIRSEYERRCRISDAKQNTIRNCFPPTTVFHCEQCFSYEHLKICNLNTLLQFEAKSNKILNPFIKKQISLFSIEHASNWIFSNMQNRFFKMQTNIFGAPFAITPFSLTILKYD